MYMDKDSHFDMIVYVRETLYYFLLIIYVEA